MSSRSVLIIGGGVAGSTCAIALARRGVSVRVVEKAVFPRRKACGCCLGPSGLNTLERLGVCARVSQKGVMIRRWVGSFDGKTVELTLPDGLAVCRTELDTLLLSQASRDGARVSEGTTARVVSLDDRRVQAAVKRGSTWNREAYDAVVVAAGLSAGNLSRLLPWTAKPDGPFGASYLAKNDRVPEGTVYMACDDDGYVGVVRLPGDQVDVAAALRQPDGGSRRPPLTRIQSMLQRAGFELGALQPTGRLFTTPRLRRRRAAGNGRLIAIGDASGYVEPFTGEGMTWAMGSGIAAAEVIAENHDLNQLGTEWRKVNERLARRQTVCLRIARGLESARQRKWAGRLLAFCPGLTRPVLNRLNRH